MNFGKFFLAAFLVSFSAHANSVADLSACVNLSKNPAQAVTFNFTSLGKQCMKEIGNKNITMTVTKPGISCVSLGKIESTKFGKCLFKKSRLSLNFDSKYQNGEAAPYAGSTEIIWQDNFRNDALYLINRSAGISACTIDKECFETAQEWKGVGNISIVFPAGMVMSEPKLQKIPAPKE